MRCAFKALKLEVTCFCTNDESMKSIQICSIDGFPHWIMIRDVGCMFHIEITLRQKYIKIFKSISLSIVFYILTHCVAMCHMAMSASGL